MYSTIVLILPFLYVFSLMLSSPVALVFLLFSFVMLNTFSAYLLSGDFFPYLLYLIYVGGMLVLVVYMVIISTNYQLSNFFHNRLLLVPASCISFMMFLYFKDSPFSLTFEKSLGSVCSLELSSSALVLLVFFLLYAFMYICESVRLGGRALKISTPKY